MDAQTFLENFAAIAEAPCGVDRLRELVLELAASGRLVESNETDVPLDVEWGLSSLKLDERKLWRATESATPNRWKTLPLARLGRWGSGGTPAKSHPEYYGGDIPWLVISDLDDGPVREAAATITPDGLGASSARLIPVGAVLVAMYGSIGKAGITTFECASNQAIAHCVPDPAVVTTPFLFRLVLSLRRHLNDQGKGAAQQNISQTILKHLVVDVPPLAEQERIVAKVDELMGLCDDLETCQERRHRTTTRFRASALHALTEAETPDDLRHAWERVESNWSAITAANGSTGDLRQTILQLAFEGRVARAGTDGGLHPDSNRPIVSGPYPIPEHWRWARFDEVADSRLGKMLDKAKNTGPLRPYLRNANLQWFRFNLSDLHELRLEDADLEAHSVRPGDLVICEGGEPGRLAVCDDTVSGMVFQKALHRARPRDDVDVWYLAYLLRCYAGNGYLSTFFTGATIKHLTGKSLGAVPVPVPPIAEQHQIVSYIKQLTAACDQLDEAMMSGTASRAALAAELTQIA